MAVRDACYLLAWVMLFFSFCAPFVDSSQSEKTEEVAAEEHHPSIVFGSDGKFHLESGPASRLDEAHDEPPEGSLVYSLFSNEMAAIASAIEQSYSTEQQYRYLRHFFPVLMNLTAENGGKIKRASLDDINRALNGLNDCNKEGVRFMLMELKASTIKHLLASELHRFYHSSAWASLDAAQRHPNVTLLFTQASLAAWYAFMPTMIELIVPSLSDGPIIVARLVQILETAGQIPTPFINFTEVLAHALSIDYAELHPRLCVVVDTLPKVSHQIDKMIRALEHRDYELCMMAYCEIHAQLGLACDASLDLGNPCEHVRHFRQI